MKAFRVTETTGSAGLPVRQQPYPHVPVGEAGHNRQLTRVAVDPRAAPTDGTLLPRASALRTETGEIVLIPEQPGDTDRALVLVSIAAGFRGSTRWTSAERVEGDCPRRLQPRSRELMNDDGGCTLCGEPVGEFHPDAGRALVFPAWPEGDHPVPGVTVLVEGHCAQGEAGAMGGHCTRLVIMEPEALIRVQRFGRLYGAPPVRYVRWFDGVLWLGTHDELFPPVAERLTGTLL